MPTGATTTAPNQSSAGAKGAAAPMPMVPFTRAAKEHIEPMFDIQQQITANTVALGPFDVPAYGYLRHIVLLVEATGGVNAGTTTAREDAPWNSLLDVQLADVNGAPIFGPLTGFDLYLANKYGGYEIIIDPKQTFSFQNVVGGAAGSGNFAFSLQIPVELNVRDALGAIANQNASSTYKVKLTLNNGAGIYSAAPTTLPVVRIRGYLKAWSQPPSADLRGRSQLTTPPAHGTSQYWSKFTPNPLAGSNTIRFTRVGNYIREAILVNRQVAANTRAAGEGDFPDPAQIFWDTRLLHNYTKKVWRDEISRRTGYINAIETAGGQDNGVFVYDWCHEFDGYLGHELRDGWLPTVQSTRIEIQGNWAANDILDVITNDVAPAGEVFV